MACKYCADIESDICVFPYYGLAPHYHDGCSVTEFIDKSLWPKNFKEDIECKNQGVYLYCEHCGDGDKP